MKELSLNILDIAMNSVKAGASVITILIEETRDLLAFSVIDDGCGMTKEQVEKLSNPFFTTRTTRKVGMGIPFLLLAAKQTGGDVIIHSLPQSENPDGHGTTLKATFNKNHIDFTPLGDIISTLITLIQGYPNIDFIFRHTVDDIEQVYLSTVEIKQTLGSDIPINSFEILDWIKQFLEEQYKK